MKRLALTFLFFFALCWQASAAGCAGTGNCYFVGGSGNTSDTTKWATTDGGAVTGSVPTSADNCNFTSLTSAVAYTATVDATLSCKDLTFALPAVSGVPTFTLNAGVTVFSNMTLVSGLVWTPGALGLTFGATATGKTVTTAGVSIGTSFTFNGAGGGWTLQDDLTIASARNLTVTNGTLNTNAKTVTTGNLVSTSGTRTLTLTNSTINITGTSGTPWNVSTAGTLTITLTGSTLNFTGGAAGVGLTIASNTFTYGTMNITGAGSWTLNTGSSTFGAFSYASTTNKTDNLRLNVGFTVAVNGTLSITGNSTVNRAFVQSATLGTSKTITVSGTTVPTLTNVDFQDTTASGNTPWTGTSLGDALGNSGITFDGSTTQTYAGGGGNWSTAALWTSRVPLPQDDVAINADSSGTLVADMPRLGRNITITNYAHTINFASVANTVFGNWSFPTNSMILAGTQSLTFAGRGAQTITSNSKAFTQAVTITAFGGSYTLQDAFSTASALTISNGTFAGSTFDLSANAFTSTGTNTRAITGSGAWSFFLVVASAGTVWNTTASLTTTGFTAQIKLTGNVASAGTMTFVGSGFTYGNLWWASTTSQGILNITGANTFNNIRVDGGNAKTLQLPAATTTTATSLTLAGTNDNLLSLISSSGGSAATLSVASGVQIANYLSIKDSTATGGATFITCNSTNVSGNSGWTFGGGNCDGGKRGLLLLGVGGWLLNRDLNPANDNNPVGLRQAA